MERDRLKGSVLLAAVLGWCAWWIYPALFLERTSEGLRQRGVELPSVWTSSFSARRWAAAIAHATGGRLDTGGVLLRLCLFPVGGLASIQHALNLGARPPRAIAARRSRKWPRLAPAVAR